jgi:hypothetical protein
MTSKSIDLQALAESLVTQEIQASSSREGVSFLVIFSQSDPSGVEQPWPTMKVMVSYLGGWNSAWSQGSTFTEDGIRMTTQAALAGLGLLSS